MDTTENYRFRSVMLVDHCQFCNFVNKKMLVTGGFAKEVITYSNAGQALEWLMKAASTAEMPGLIFVNLNLRRMNGNEFSVRVEDILQRSIYKPRIVLLSSSLSHDQMMHLKENKMVFAHLSRPLIKHDLDQLATLAA